MFNNLKSNLSQRRELCELVRFIVDLSTLGCCERYFTAFHHVASELDRLTQIFDSYNQTSALLVVSEESNCNGPAAFFQFMQHVEANRVTVLTQTEVCDEAGMSNMLDPMSMSADALILLEQSCSQSSVGQQLSASVKDIWKHDSGPKWPHLNWIIILKCVFTIKLKPTSFIK